MQNAVIGIVIGTTLLGSIVLAMRLGSHGRGVIWFQIALGLIVGAIAGAIVVSMRADLVPDDIEAAAAVAIALTATLILIVVQHNVA